LPIPALGEAVFAAPQGGVTAPVQSPFGWHVMRVERITPGATMPPEQAEARLRADIAAEKAGDLAFERANRVEDAIAGGATLAEAAARYGMSVAPVTVDARGNDASGAPVPLPVPPAARSEAIRAIFAAQPGAAPRLTETRDGSAFLAAELRSVTPPALRPLAEVEEEVRLAYLNDARRRHQEAAASALLAQVRGGQALATAAARSERFGAFGREAERGAAPGTSVPPELLPALFNLRPGEATMVPTRDGFAVAQLLEVVPADPAADPAALATMTREIQSSAADDLEAQYAAALRRRAEPRINPSLMQQVVP
jgi:peptidyl-prolyl cis-trans isomerase D